MQIQINKSHNGKLERFIVLLLNYYMKGNIYNYMEWKKIPKEGSYHPRIEARGINSKFIASRAALLIFLIIWRISIG